MSIAILEKERTIGAGLDAWLATGEEKGTLTGEDLHSAKSFSRAFKIWFDKANGENQCQETLVSGDLAMEFEFFADDFSMGFDPDEDEESRAQDPRTKTTRIASNAIAYINFLSATSSSWENPLMTPTETTEAISYLTSMEVDLKRIQRAEWVLRAHEIYFNPILNEGDDSRRSIVLEGEEEQSLFEVADIQDNFVLADTCDVTDTDADPIGSPNDPVKIYIPSVVTPYLAVGDDLHVGITKVKGADYWVITCLLAIEPGTRKYEEYDSSKCEGLDADLSAKLSLFEGEDKEEDKKDRKTHLELITALRADPAYQARRTELLERSPPNDTFPQDKYQETWFSSCEIDIASDEEDIGGFWDMEDSDSDDDDDDEDDDSESIKA